MEYLVKQTNYLKIGWKKTRKAIKNHPLLAVILVLVQIIFLVSFIFTLLNYHTLIFQSLEDIMVGLQGAEYSAEAIESGTPFLQDFYSIYSSFETLKSNAIRLIVDSTLMYLIINGFIWISSLMMINLGKYKIKEYWNKKFWKQIGLQSLKFTATSLSAIIVFAIVAYFVFSNVFAKGEPELMNQALKTLGIVAAVLYYFLMSSFVNINIVSWKNFVKKIYEISIKNIIKTILVLAINLLILFLGFYIIFLTVSSETYSSLVIPATILFSILMIFTKLFWIGSLKSLNKEM